MLTLCILCRCNYRSTGPIVYACNTLSNHNRARQSMGDGDKGSEDNQDTVHSCMKQMYPVSAQENGPQVRVVECMGGLDVEYEHVVHTLRSLLSPTSTTRSTLSVDASGPWHDEVIYPKDIAVLCRTNNIVKSVRLVLPV